MGDHTGALKKFLEIETIKSLTPEQINEMFNKLHDENKELKSKNRKYEDNLEEEFRKRKHSVLLKDMNIIPIYTYKARADVVFILGKEMSLDNSLSAHMAICIIDHKHNTYVALKLSTLRKIVKYIIKLNWLEPRYMTEAEKRSVYMAKKSILRKEKN